MVIVKIVICDDELTFADKIYKYIVDKFNDAVIDKYTDGAALLQNCTKRYDVAFLDIEMAGFSGFDLAKQLVQQNENIILVFISNYEEKVYESFRYRPLRFVRKSQLDKEIGEAMEAVKQNYRSKHMFMEFIDTDKIIRQANVNDIMYFESNRHYIKVVTERESFVIREKMSELEAKFEQYNFVRIQIGYIVNMKYIRSINGYSVLLDNDINLSIGRNNLLAVKNRYMDYVRTVYNR